jgi:hypothetical protein
VGVLSFIVIAAVALGLLYLAIRLLSVCVRVLLYLLTGQFIKYRPGQRKE